MRRKRKIKEKPSGFLLKERRLSTYNSLPKKVRSSGAPKRRLEGIRLGRLVKKFWLRLRELLLGKRFLCDTCRYDYGLACTRRERPNATRCPDYKKR